MSFYHTAGLLGFNSPKPCMPGHYCPSQTPSPTRYPCPSGTYSDRSDLAKPEDCYICPATKYCSGMYSSWVFDNYLKRQVCVCVCVCVVYFLYVV